MADFFFATPYMTHFCARSTHSWKVFKRESDLSNHIVHRRCLEFSNNSSTVIWTGWYGVKSLKQVKTSMCPPHISSTSTSSRLRLFQVQRCRLLILLALILSAPLFTTSSATVLSRVDIIFSTQALSSSQPVNFRCCSSVKQAFAVAQAPMQGSRTIPSGLLKFRKMWCITEIGFCSGRSISVFQNLWLVCLCQTQFLQTKTLGFLTQCLHLMENRWHVQVVCGSPHIVRAR